MVLEFHQVPEAMDAQYRQLHDIRDERGAGNWMHCRGCRMQRTRGDKAIAYADQW